MIPKIFIEKFIIILDELLRYLASATFFRASFIAINPFLVFSTETMSLNRPTPRPVKHSP